MTLQTFTCFNDIIYPPSTLSADLRFSFGNLLSFQFLLTSVCKFSPVFFLFSSVPYLFVSINEYEYVIIVFL